MRTTAIGLRCRLVAAEYRMTVRSFSVVHLSSRLVTLCWPKQPSYEELCDSFVPCEVTEMTQTKGHERPPTYITILVVFLLALLAAAVLVIGYILTVGCIIGCPG